jgi:hypothetical protein
MAFFRSLGLAQALLGFQRGVELHLRDARGRAPPHGGIAFAQIGHEHLALPFEDLFLVSRSAMIEIGAAAFAPTFLAVATRPCAPETHDHGDPRKPGFLVAPLPLVPRLNLLR